MRGPPGHVLLPFHWQMTNFISADDRHAYGRVQFVGRASAREDSLETYASDRRFRLAVCRILRLRTACDQPTDSDVRQTPSSRNPGHRDARPARCAYAVVARGALWNVHP